jgi:transposase
MKGVPGRKTDMQDAEWIAELLQYGLIRGSFVPPEAQRELRLLNRHRHNVITRRAQVINEIQKLLEDANIKLSNVVSDINGISATAILKELAVGHCDPEVLKELARGKLKQKKDLLREALTGRVCKQHRLILSQLLAEISHYDEQIEEMSKEIEERMIADQDKIDRLDDIPGVDRRVSETILSELGSDLSRFTDEHHAASWAGICPGNNESAGKRHSSRTRAGDKPLKSALIQAANAARHTRNTYLAAQYHRIAARRGHKRAIVAVAHSIFIIAYHIIHRGTRYQDLGADYFDRRNPDATIRRLVRRIKHLGYEVNLSPVEAVA